MLSSTECKELIKVKVRRERGINTWCAMQVRRKMASFMEFIDNNYLILEIISSNSVILCCCRLKISIGAKTRDGQL